MKWYITNQAHSTKLVSIILYPASPRIIIFLTNHPCWLYSDPQQLLSAIFSHSCKNGSACFNADTFLDHIKYSMYRNCVWPAKENAATLTSVVQILTIINKYSSSPHEAMKARRIPYCFITIQLVDQKNMGKKHLSLVYKTLLFTTGGL